MVLNRLFSLSVPPDKPIIRNQEGQEMVSYEIGPYEIDEDLMIDCEVIGGELSTGFQINRV